MNEIPGSAFVPPPKVDAGIVRLIPLQRPLTSVPFPYVEKLVRHAFHFRSVYSFARACQSDSFCLQNLGSLHYFTSL